MRIAHATLAALVGLAFVLGLSSHVAWASPRELSDDAVAKLLIRQSIEEYPGNCPCPFNTDRAGRSCGRRSAYNRAGGYAPLCYRRDVTAAMIADYRKRR